MKVVFVLLVSGLISYSTLSTSEVLFSEVEGIPSSEEDIEFLSPDSLSFALESEPAETLVTDTSIVDSLILSDDSSRTRPEEPMFVGLEIGTAGEDVYIASDHVGIGTSTPSELLEIYNGNLMIRGNDGATMRIGEGVDYYEMILDYDVGDEGTGLFIRSNGTDRVTMLSTGNVGIGTTSPDKKLNVGESGGANLLLTREDGATTVNELLGQILFESTDGGVSSVDASAMIRAYASETHVSTDKGAYMTFETKPTNRNGNEAAYERMRIDNDGSIAIWDASASINGATGSGELYVENDFECDGRIYLGTTYGSAGQVLTSNGSSDAHWTTPTTGDITGVTAGLDLNNGGASGTVTLNIEPTLDYVDRINFGHGDYGLRFDSDDTRIYANTSTSEDLMLEADDDIYITPDDDIQLSPGDDIQLPGSGIWKHEGDVGIGTSTPSELLEIYNGNLMIRGNDGATMRIGEGVDYYEMILDYDVGDEGTGLFIRSNGTDRVTMLSTGNVGIGTTSPSAKLHVAGDARVTGRFYDSSGDAGTSGQVLSSTGTGTDWVDGGGSASCSDVNESFETGIIAGPWGDWANTTGDDDDWERKTGSTTSSNTGPTSASDGTYYIYCETSGSSSGDQYYVQADVTLCSSPSIEFDYHMYFSTHTDGTLLLNVSTTGGSTWGTIWSDVGNQGTSWQNTTRSLASYAGDDVIIRFAFTVGSGSSYQYDCALDDITIYDMDDGARRRISPFADEHDEARITYECISSVEPGDVLALSRDGSGRLIPATSSNTITVGVATSDLIMKRDDALKSDADFNDIESEIIELENRGASETALTEIAERKATMEREYSNYFVAIEKESEAIANCDASFGEIRKGDMLTLSETPGHARGLGDNESGLIVGIAMENLESGTGKIIVLVKDGYYSAPVESQIQEDMESLIQRIEALEKQISEM